MTSYTDETEWQRHRLCGFEDAELFYPIGQTDAAKKQRKEIHAFCKPCPVKMDCLLHAMIQEWDHPSDAHGYFGDRGPDSRKKYIANLKKKGLSKDDLSNRIVSRVGRRQQAAA